MPKGQGKISVDKVIKGILGGMKKKDIAPMAGSNAKLDKHRINAVNQVRTTKEYKEKTVSLLKKLENERERIVDNMMEKDLGEVDHSELSLSLERVNKVTELLGGKATERVDSTSEDLLAFLKTA